MTEEEKTLGASSNQAVRPDVRLGIFQRLFRSKFARAGAALGAATAGTLASASVAHGMDLSSPTGLSPDDQNSDWGKAEIHADYQAPTGTASLEGNNLVVSSSPVPESTVNVEVVPAPAQTSVSEIVDRSPAPKAEQGTKPMAPATIPAPPAPKPTVAASPALPSPENHGSPAIGPFKASLVKPLYEDHLGIKYDKSTDTTTFVYVGDVNAARQELHDYLANFGISNPSQITGKVVPPKSGF